MAKAISGINDLETMHPELLAEWDYEKNSDLKPSEVMSGSNKKVWWICALGHKWQITVNQRTRKDTGCPYCAKRKLLIGFNDIATLYPELLSEWDYEKNDVLPTEITPRSAKKIWWICPLGHSYSTGIYFRACKNKRNCPVCAGKKIEIGFNDFASIHPELLSEWNYEKNNILPIEIAVGSNKKVWWKCKFGHEWQATADNRHHNNSGCPYCASKKIKIGFNDFASIHPELLSEWDYEKNDILPTEVTSGSKKKVWWLCSFGHSYSAPVYSHTGNKKQGCPVCAKENHTSFPEQALFYYVKKFFPDSINGDTLRIGMELDIFIPSLNIAIEYDGGHWHNNENLELKKNKLCIENKVLLIRIREEGLTIYDDCICLIRKNPTLNQSLSDVICELLNVLDNTIKADINVNDDLIDIYSLYVSLRKKKSLSSMYPEIAKEWHHTKNGTLTPDMTTPTSGKKVWWLGSCGHEWAMTVANRTTGNCNCPYCNGGRYLKGFNDFETKYPDLCSEWDYSRNNILPSEVSPSDRKKVWWKCKNGHEYLASLNNRTNHYTGCPYCSNKKALSGYNDLSVTHPALLLEWNYEKNEIKPGDITYGSTKKVWWKCNKGHEWEESPNRRTNKKGGCPYCANNKVLIGYNDLATTHPQLLAEWDYSKNDILPTKIIAGSSKRIWWKCSNGHEWNAVLDSRAHGNHGCPKCASHSKSAKAVINLDTGIIYESATKAGNELNIAPGLISGVCRGEHQTAGKYHWDYLEHQTIKDRRTIT